MFIKANITEMSLEEVDAVAGGASVAASPVFTFLPIGLPIRWIPKPDRNRVPTFGRIDPIRH